jgi:hypothetical protein
MIIGSPMTDLPFPEVLTEELFWPQSRAEGLKKGGVQNGKAMKMGRI